MVTARISELERPGEPGSSMTLYSPWPAEPQRSLTLPSTSRESDRSDLSTLTLSSTNVGVTHNKFDDID